MNLLKYEIEDLLFCVQSHEAKAKATDVGVGCRPAMKDPDADITRARAKSSVGQVRTARVLNRHGAKRGGNEREISLVRVELAQNERVTRFHQLRRSRNLAERGGPKGTSRIQSSKRRALLQQPISLSLAT